MPTKAVAAASVPAVNMATRSGTGTEAEASMRSLHVNGHDMAYAGHGTGSPLLLVHGTLLEPISTATTEGTVPWLLHRRMGANQQMRWSPRGAHRMLQVRTAVANGTLADDHLAAERWARRPFRPAA